MASETSGDAHSRRWQDQRLESIERKLDTMSDAIVALARMEERMITLFNRMDGFDAVQTKHDERIAGIEGRVGSNGQTLRFVERVFWIVVSAGVALLFQYKG